MSVQNAVISEFTQMVLLEIEKGRPTEALNKQKVFLLVSLFHWTIIFL